MTKAEKERGQERERTRNAYKWFLTSTDGELVLQDLIDSYSDRSSYTTGDPYATAYKEGQRSVVLELQALLQELKGEPS